MNNRITFIFPVYNEEETINKLYQEIIKVIKYIQKKYEYELIFVNDGSEDNTLKKLKFISRNNKNLKIINLSRNFGHQLAITAGLDYANGDAVIIMDSDLQDPPLVCLQLIKSWEKGYDVVYAKRKTRKDSIFKKWSAFLFYRMINTLSGIYIPEDTGDFRLLDGRVVREIRKFRERNRYLRGLVPYVGFKQTYVLFDRNKRFAGKTHYPLIKMIKLAFDAVTSFSLFPLIFIAQIGFFVSLLSIVGIVYALVLRVFYPEITVSGWTLLMISIFFIGGVQMIMLGIIGTYIGRIYTEVQNRPLYTIESLINSKSKV